MHRGAEGLPELLHYVQSPPPRRGVLSIKDRSLVLLLVASFASTSLRGSRTAQQGMPVRLYLACAHEALLQVVLKALLLPSQSDLRPRRQRSSAFPVTPFQAALLFLLAFTYSFASIHYHLPPFSWIDDWKHRHDKVVQHRPAFKKVERCVLNSLRGA